MKNQREERCYLCSKTISPGCGEVERHVGYGTRARHLTCRPAKVAKRFKIEIYEKASGRVVETQETGDYAAFLFYWTRQCDTKTFGHRIAP
jgi:hypothetical protein